MDSVLSISFSQCNMINTNFITLPKPWYEITYISVCRYDALTAPALTGYALSETITIG